MSLNKIKMNACHKTEKEFNGRRTVAELPLMVLEGGGGGVPERKKTNAFNQFSMFYCILGVCNS